MKLGSRVRLSTILHGGLRGTAARLYDKVLNRAESGHLQDKTTSLYIPCMQLVCAGSCLPLQNLSSLIVTTRWQHEVNTPGDTFYQIRSSTSSLSRGKEPTIPWSREKELSKPFRSESAAQERKIIGVAQQLPRHEHVWHSLGKYGQPASAFNFFRRDFPGDLGQPRPRAASFCGT